MEIASGLDYGIVIQDNGLDRDPMYITIENLRITNFGRTGILVTDGDWITIQACEPATTYINAPGISIDGTSGDYCQGTLIVNKMIYGASIASIWLTNTPGADLIFNSIYQYAHSGIRMDSPNETDVPARDIE